MLKLQAKDQEINPDSEETESEASEASGSEINVIHVTAPRVETRITVLALIRRPIGPLRVSANVPPNRTNLSTTTRFFRHLETRRSTAETIIETAGRPEKRQLPTPTPTGGLALKR